MLKIIGVFLIVTLLIPAFVALEAFIIMVVSGAVGHVFEEDAFFISFWQAVVVGIALSVVGGFFRGSSK